MKAFFKRLFCWHLRWESTTYHIHFRLYEYENTCKVCGKVRYTQELPVNQL